MAGKHLGVFTKIRGFIRYILVEDKLLYDEIKPITSDRQIPDWGQIQALIDALADGGLFLKIAGGNSMAADLDAGGYNLIHVGVLTDLSERAIISAIPGRRWGVDANGNRSIDFTDVVKGLGLFLPDASATTFLIPTSTSNENIRFPNLGGAGGDVAIILNTAYGAGWSGDVTHTPSADKLYSKISSLDAQITALSLYIGKYVSLSALQTAYPISTSGHWAIVDAGSGTNAVEYIWDEQEGWVIGSGSSGVASVFGRTGVVTAMSGDYTTAQITEVTNLFFTVARVYLATLSAWTPIAGIVANGDTLQQVLQKLSGNISALLTLPVYPVNDNQIYDLTVINGIVIWKARTYVSGTSSTNKSKLQADLTSDWDSSQTYIGTTSGVITGSKGGEEFKAQGGNGNWYTYKALADNVWDRTLKQ